ncbi:MAG: hypothetical protein Kow0069_30020 [Promethearchaeota archaeon]
MWAAEGHVKGARDDATESREDIDLYWVVPGRLAGSSYPFADLPEYHARGIRAIVSFIPVPPVAEVLMEKFGVDHLFLFVELMGWPNDEQAGRMVNFVDDQLAKDRPVLMHCLQGNGRTGAALGMYLVWTGVPAAEAIELVRRVRSTAFDVPEQERAVEIFEEQLPRFRKRVGRDGPPFELLR